MGMFFARRVITPSLKIELDCSFHTALRMFHDPLTCLFVFVFVSVLQCAASLIVRL